MNSDPNILHLTLKRLYFDQIASGEKTIEYRDYKDYWRVRLEGREYDEIHFRNGYSPTSPFMRVEWKGLEMGDEYYEIQLGKILEVRNYG